MSDEITEVSKILVNPILKRWDSLLADESFWTARDAEISANEERERRSAELAKMQAQEERASRVPSIYREKFDRSRAGYAQEVVDRVARWSSRDAMGIGLIGSTGLGKTRLLCAKLITLQCSWVYVPASALGRAVGQQYSDDWSVARNALQTLRDARNVRVLMLDDIGDENPTEAVSSEFKAIVEARTSRGLPILWTCNLSGEELTKHHKTRGAAIVRRLREFTWTP